MSKKVHQIQTTRSRLFLRSTVAPFLSQKKLTRASQLCLEHFEKFLAKELKLKSKCNELSLTLCGARKMQTINRDFRNKDKPTDVLSFPMESMLYQMGELPPYLTQLLLLGDIVICKEVLLKQAKSYGVTPIEEFVRLFVHGLLHLTDMDHERSTKEEKMMFEIQDRLIAKIMKKL